MGFWTVFIGYLCVAFGTTGLCFLIDYLGWVEPQPPPNSRMIRVHASFLSGLIWPLFWSLVAAMWIVFLALKVVKYFKK